MIAQVFWLFFIYALVGGVAGALLEAGNTPVAVVVMIGVPAFRIWRRFRLRKGYYLMSFLGQPDSLRDASFRVTPQVHRSLFLVMVGIELAIATFVLLGVLVHAPVRYLDEPTEVVPP